MPRNLDDLETSSMILYYDDDAFDESRTIEPKDHVDRNNKNTNYARGASAAEYPEQQLLEDLDLESVIDYNVGRNSVSTARQASVAASTASSTFGVVAPRRALAQQRLATPNSSRDDSDAPVSVAVPSRSPQRASQSVVTSGAHSTPQRAPSSRRPPAAAASAATSDLGLVELERLRLENAKLVEQVTRREDEVRALNDRLAMLSDDHQLALERIATTTANRVRELMQKVREAEIAQIRAAKESDELRNRCDDLEHQLSDAQRALHQLQQQASATQTTTTRSLVGGGRFVPATAVETQVTPARAYLAPFDDDPYQQFHGRRLPPAPPPPPPPPLQQQQQQAPTVAQPSLSGGGSAPMLLQISDLKALSELLRGVESAASLPSSQVVQQHRSPPRPSPVVPSSSPPRPPLELQQQLPTQTQTLQHQQQHPRWSPPRAQPAAVVEADDAHFDGYHSDGPTHRHRHDGNAAVPEAPPPQTSRPRRLYNGLKAIPLTKPQPQHQHPLEAHIDPTQPLHGGGSTTTTIIIHDKNETRHDNNGNEIADLETRLYDACRRKDDVELQYQKVECLKVRSLADKAKKETLQRKLKEYSDEVGAIRRRLRELSALER